MSKKTFSSQEKMLIDKKQEIKHINLYQPSIKRKNKNSIKKIQDNIKKSIDNRLQFKTSIQQKKINFRGTKKQKNSNQQKGQGEQLQQFQQSYSDINKTSKSKSKQKQKQFQKLEQKSQLKGEEMFQQIYKHLLENKDKPEIMQHIYKTIFDQQQQVLQPKNIKSNKNCLDNIPFQTSVSDISNTLNTSTTKVPMQSFKITQSEFHPHDNAEKIQSHKLIFNSEVLKQQDDFNLYKSQKQQIIRLTFNKGWTQNHKFGLTCIKFYNDQYQQLEVQCQYYINDKLVNRNFIKLFQNLKIKQKETFFNHKVYNIFKFKFKNNEICSAICFWNIMSEPNLGIKKILLEKMGQSIEIKIPKSEICKPLDKNFYIHKLNQNIDPLKLRLKIQKQLANIEFKNTLMPLRKSSSFVNPHKQIETPRFYPKEKLNKTIELQREQFLKQQKIHSMSIDLEELNFAHKKNSYQIPLLKKSLIPRKDILSRSFNNQKNLYASRKNVQKQDNKLFKDDQNYFNFSNKMRKKSNSLVVSDFSKFSMNNSIISDNQLEDFIGNFTNHQIPQLPIVDGIIIQINSNWGDKSFVGLNDIEIFNYEGEKMIIQEQNCEIFSYSKQGVFDIDNNNSNLFNSHIITQQKEQQWKISLKYKFPIYIKIKFSNDVQIAMIRIWNYNVNRINKNIGIKQVMITNIDKDILLFCGKIKKALGGSIQLFKNNQETILFTQDVQIIQKLSKNDWLYQLKNQKKKQKLKAQCLINNIYIQRPITQDQNQSISKNNILKQYKSRNQNILENEYILCKKIKLILNENWGHQKLIGFEKIYFLDNNLKIISNDNFQMKSNLKFNNKSFNFLDSKFLQSDKTKYFIFKEYKNQYIEIIFNQKVKLSTIKIKNVTSKNFIKSSIKNLSIQLDNQVQTPKEGFFIKKISQVDEQNQYELINFPIKTQFMLNSLGNVSAQPTGFNLKIHLINTYGDLYYIGLNEIQIYDQDGLLIDQNNFKVTAKPEGVYILDQMEKDQRKVINLFNGITNSKSQKDIFLAPLEKSKSLLNYTFYNKIIIEFNEPQTIGKIIFYNYQKTTQRAVKEIKIFLDDYLLRYDILNHPSMQQSTTFYFNKELQKKESKYDLNTINTENLLEQIQLVNENEVIIKKVDEFEQNLERPQTGANDNSIL